MYAIVEIAGQQFKVEKDRTVYTHRLAARKALHWFSTRYYLLIKAEM